MLCIGLVSPIGHFFLSSITLSPLDTIYFSLYTYHYLIFTTHLLTHCCLPSSILCPILLQCKFPTCRNLPCFIHCTIPTVPGRSQALQKDLLNKARHECLSAPTGGLCFVSPTLKCVPKPFPLCHPTAGQIWILSNCPVYFLSVSISAGAQER